jgi:cytochrome P450
MVSSAVTLILASKQPLQHALCRCFAHLSRHPRIDVRRKVASGLHEVCEGRAARFCGRTAAHASFVSPSRLLADCEEFRRGAVPVLAAAGHRL